MTAKTVLKLAHDAPGADPGREAAATKVAGAIPLRWRTRETTRHLLEACLASVALCLVTAVPLWLDAGDANLLQVLLVTHLAAGTLGLFFLIPYLASHLKDGREPWKDLLWPFRLIPELRWEPYAAKRLHGHALMWGLLVVFASGLLLSAPALLYLAGVPRTLPYGGGAWLLRIHEWATAAAVALMLLHIPARETRQ